MAASFLYASLDARCSSRAASRLALLSSRPNCATVRCAASVAVVTARPHPMPVLRRDWHFEDATDDDAVFKHVKIVLAPADRGALEDYLGHLARSTLRLALHSRRPKS